MVHRFALVASTVLVVAGFAGCGSGSPGPATTASASSAVSFRSDIAPVFASSCATDSACHGTADGANLYLAAPIHDATLTLSRLVNQASLEVPSMPYVAPGDPANSFLMHKLDGDLSSLGACTSGLCGVAMPKNGTALDQATRDKIREWIAQGAKDD